LLAPVDGTVGVSPTTPLTISITGGTLAEVQLVDGTGTPVAGGVVSAPADPLTASWAPTTPLAYGTSYTLTATAENAAHERTQAATRFTTATPETLSNPAIDPLEGKTVGVGMPIRVSFDQPVVNKAAVESALEVISSRPTDGVWSWMNNREVHFRPSTYWPAHTDVRLEADLLGVDFGNGVWGGSNRTVSFAIGDRHVSYVDAAAHVLRVLDGSRLVQTFPMSAGSPENPTRNGPHVVSEFRRNMTMDSSSFGLPVNAPGGYRIDVEYAVRISNNGEFVHAAPWSVAQQGNSNVSHGCINLSTERAAWFFQFSQPGDIVEVRNSTGPKLSAADGDIYDWAIPWEQWRAGSALQ
jgi:lipoprotein-anchoring transpeptidase ErfK/SrfK